MTTLLRLLAFIRRTSVSKIKITKINLENFTTDALLHPETVFITKQWVWHAMNITYEFVVQCFTRILFIRRFKNYSSLEKTKEKTETNQVSSLDLKMKELNRINHYRMVSKLNIDDILCDIKLSGKSIRLYLDRMQGIISNT